MPSVAASLLPYCSNHHSSADSHALARCRLVSNGHELSRGTTPTYAAAFPFPLYLGSFPRGHLALLLQAISDTPVPTPFLIPVTVHPCPLVHPPHVLSSHVVPLHARLSLAAASLPMRLTSQKLSDSCNTS